MAAIIPQGVRQKIKACKEGEQKKEIFLLSKAGHSIFDISQRLGISSARVRKLIHELYDEEAEHLIDLTRREIVIQLNRLDWIYAEAGSEWERSKTGRVEDLDKTEEVPAKAATGPGTGRAAQKFKTKSVKKTTNFGDPRYLELMRSTLAQRLKILGLENPEKMQIEQIITMTQKSDISISVERPELSAAHMAEVARLMAQMGINPTLSGMLEAPDVLEATFTDGKEGITAAADDKPDTEARSAPVEVLGA